MPEAHKKSFETLLSDYRDLQLRVTQFSNVEQELINAKDKLDRELVSHRRLNVFIQNALKEISNVQFVQLVAESIIDILELEASVVWFSDLGDNGNGVFYSEGLFSNIDDLKNELIHQSAKVSNEFLKKIEGNAFENKNLEKLISEGLIFQYNTNDSGNSFVLLGLITDENAPLYEQIHKRHETIFSLFAQQVKSIYLNRKKSEKIKEQIIQISNSELELKKLSLIATKTKNGVIISDSHGRIEWVNNAFTEINGYSLEEVKGRKPKDFLQSNQSDSNVLSNLSNALAKKENIEVIVKNTTKNNKQYYNQLEITPVFDEHGNHTNFIALQKDITAESLIRDELLRVNSRFELITQKSKIGIWEKSFQVDKTTWNDILYDQYGIQKADSNDLYAVWFNAIHPEDKPYVVSQTDLIFNGSIDLVELEYRIVLIANSDVKYVQCITIAEKDESGNVIRVLGSSVDVTERKRNEELIKNQNESLKINLLEIEKGKSEIEKVNQNLEHLVNEKTIKNIQLAKSIADQEKLVTVGEIASGVAHDLNTPLGAIKIGAESILYTIDKIGEVISKCSETQIKFAFELTKKADAKNFIGGLQLRKEITLFKEKLKGLKSELTQNELHQLAELFVKSNIKLSEDIAIITILNAENSVDFAGLVYQLSLLNNFVKTITSSGEKASKVVQDLRSFIKDQKNSGRGIVNLNANILSVLNIFSFEIAKSCDLKFDVDKSLEINGFEIRLFQLWSNIIKNAIEAIEETNRKGKIRIYSKESSERFIIIIENNGPKIPDDVINSMFKKFFTTKGQKNGSGLGLSIVNKILEEHEASIDVSSDDTLTRFEISFPKAQNIC